MQAKKVRVQVGRSSRRKSIAERNDGNEGRERERGRGRERDIEAREGGAGEANTRRQHGGRVGDDWAKTRAARGMSHHGGGGGVCHP
jgi:hypothetical protein